MEGTERVASAAYIVDVLSNLPYREISHLPDAVYRALQDGQLTQEEYDRFLYNPEVLNSVRSKWARMKSGNNSPSRSSIS